MSESVNPTLTKFEDIFKAVAWDTLVTGGLLAAIGPKILAIPLVGPIVRAFVTNMSNKFFEFLRKRFDVAAIPILNTARKRKYEDLTALVLIAEMEKGFGSPEYLKVREDAKKAFADWVHFNG